ncbi:D-glyceryl-ACP synthase [Faunimonas pinastri]|uniref:D-glyceryl-ACP synthase n=1 Tax=Faunimonas pinastri TaxID=1855383 RepID=A0A1H9FHI1_9HYPH|nr:HAD-IIIC family phosphatase [Faunimonas pinastri]SEQ37265.1 D-glyceryl-ACP synthase [Faunimonas pinastri]
MVAPFVQLPWLPAAPADFASLCRRFGSGEGPAGAEAQRLSNFALDATQSGSLSRAIARRRKAKADFAPLSPFRLGLLSNATTDLIADCLPAAAARHGVLLDLVTTPFDQVMQQALDPSSETNNAGLDAVLVAVDHRWLQLDRSRLGGGDEQSAAALEQLRTVVTALRGNRAAPPILQTVPVPPSPLFGSYERRVRGTIRTMIEDVNRGILDLADETGCTVLDTAALAERIGTDLWFDAVQWGAYKLPFAAEAGPAHADMVGRLLGAIRGKARKCLVLDLDNTVWGGVIGDDGMEGIKIGQGSAVGEAFLAVQHAALDLRDRGIILAVSSKNDDEVARRPFREHPDMALKESHISVFQANWSDKASNLESIARSLNIGLDALVLLDDNPAERAQLRAALPMVAVPELPQDPSWYPGILFAAGYFEAVTFSAEDRIRVQSYASDAQRAEVFATSRDLGDYLGSLAMVMTATPFDVQGRQRITQLTNKTNQFNLTTRRYRESDIAAFDADPAVWTLQVRLQDRFGDLGMIALVICRTRRDGEETAWDIDTWLMSCRVLGRKVEEAMLAEVVAGARETGVARLRGTYIPTAKNGMVAEHYSRLGFSMVEEATDGTRYYELDVARYEAPDLPMTVRHGSVRTPESA